MSKPQGQRNSFEKGNTPHRFNSKNTNRCPSTEKADKPKNGTAASTDSTNGHADVGVLQDESFQAHQHDRLLFLIMNSIGAEIFVKTNSGTTLTGTVESIDPKTLKVVMKSEGKAVSVQFDDVIDFELQSIDLFNASTYKTAGSFKTDTDISNRGTSSSQRRQEIEKWVPDASTPSGLSLENMSLEDGANTKWDQFETNEQKFGIKSEFDEHLYTTKINKNDPEYQKKMKEADRIAREIETGVTENSHLAEERGIKFDDSGIDEEDKYSGVARKPSTAKGDALFASLINKGQDSKNLSFTAQEKATKYVPPSQRDRLQNIDPSIVSAIGSRKGAAAAVTTASVAQTPSPAQAPVAEAKPVVKPTSELRAPNSNLPAKPILTSRPGNALAENRSQQAYEHSKKLSAMSELNSLKEFSQNFKIPGKFPQDLLPIITKDKSKQEEIIKKSEAATAKSSPKATGVAPSSSVSSNEAPTAAATGSAQPSPGPAQGKPAAPAQTTPVPAPDTPSTKKVEAKHKLNPKAAAFTPSTFSSPASGVISPQLSRNSPRIAQANFRQKKPHTPAFFSPDRVPSANKKRSLGDDFNFFKTCYKEYKATKATTPFSIEKPYATAPTWSRDEETRPFKSQFPEFGPNKMAPVQPQHQIPPYQPMPMMQAPQMFYQPQFPSMRMSPQPPQPMLAPNDGNFMPGQRMQPMYMQQGMPPMNVPAPMQYQRGFPQGGFPSHPGAGPMPGMMPPPHSQGRMHNGGYKNH